MNLPLKRFIRSISLVMLCMLLPWNIILSCGPSLSNDEAQFSVFNIAIDSASGLKAYTYSNSLFGDFTPDMEPDYKRNCREWETYSKNEANEKDIYTIQYETAPSVFIQAYQHNKWENF